MQTSKAVHWRTRELVKWAALHGAVDTFKINTGVMQGKSAISRETTQAELLGRLGDPDWRAVHVSWYAKKFRGSVMIYTVSMLPAALMRSHDAKDVVRYLFELPNYAQVGRVLKENRSEEMASRWVKASPDASSV
jgi:hypothetical protein